MLTKDEVNTATHLLNNLVRQIKETESAASKVRFALPSNSSYDKKENALKVKAAKTLLPLFRVLKREGSRFILPSGTKVRFNKLRFIYKEEMKEPTHQWGDHKFIVEQGGNYATIYYSFNTIYPSTDFNSSWKTTTKVYDWDLYSIKQMHSIHAFLESGDDAYLENIAKFGFTDSNEMKNNRIKLAELNSEITNLKAILSEVKQLLKYNRNSGYIIDAAKNPSNFKNFSSSNNW